jgi:hypothetical protein
MQTKIVEYGGTRPFDSLAAIMLDAKVEEYLKSELDCHPNHSFTHSTTFQSVDRCTQHSPVFITRITRVSVLSLMPRRTPTEKATIVTRQCFLIV